MARGSNFTLVQELRGFAATWVVLFHANEGGHIPGLKAALPTPLTSVIFDAGHYGVAIFFALSGFVIAHSLRAYEPSFAFLGRFALRRSIRLDPPYWLSIVVAVVFASISSRVVGKTYRIPDLGTLAAHIAYLQVLLGKPEINIVYWTLTYEVQFYLFLVLTLVLAGKRRGLVVLAWMVMTSLAFASAWGLFRQIPSGIFLSLWASFFVGVLGYRAQRGWWFVLALLVGTMWLSPGADAFSRISSATALLLTISHKSGAIERGLGWPWLSFLGTISYSLYLLHNPLTGATGFLVRRYLGAGFTASLVSLIAILFVTISAATLCWLVIERPTHRLAKRLGKRQQEESKPSLVTTLTTSDLA